MMQFDVPSDVLGFGFLALVVVLLIAFLGAILYFDHRKTMVLIETGEYEHSDDRAWILAVGLLLVAIGVGHLIESLSVGGPLGGVTTALVGVAALAYYYLKRRERRASSTATDSDGLEG